MNDTPAPSSLTSLLVILFLLVLSPAAWGGAGTDHLLKGEYLSSGEYLTLSNGERILVMQGDGNLVLRGREVRRQLWQSGTAGHPGAHYSMQGDGNLVIYSAEWEPLWSSKTSGNPGSELVMEDDGNLVVYSPPQRVALWASGTSGNPGAHYSMQGDGNLVVYSTEWEPLWSSKTSGNPGATLFLDDGNLGIVSAPETKAVWSSGTWGNPGAKLEFVDGALVIYSAEGQLLWNTPTGKYCQRKWPLYDCPQQFDWWMSSWEFTEDGDLLVYPPPPRILDNHYEIWHSDTAGTPNPELVMHNDGNLVIKSTVSTRLWETGTGEHPGSELEMQGDGNLVVYSALEPQPLWESRTAGNPGAELIMREDGNLVILGPPVRKCLWASGTYGHRGAHVTMQGDGNLVVRSAEWEPLWASGTGGHEPPYPHLELQLDGNLVLYFEEGHKDARWATHTFRAWMDLLGANIADFSLRELVIPGTHDSGTFGLQDWHWADDQKVPKTIFDIDGYLPWHVEGHGHWVKHYTAWWPHLPYWTFEIHWTPHAKYMYAFSRTQHKGFTSQLHNGIRYLDLRVLYDHGGLYLIHTLRGPDVFVEIDAVNDYLRENPYEIVILDFQHFFTQDGPKSIPEKWNRKLIQHIQRKLGDLLIPPPADVNQLTVGDVWGEGKQVIVFYNQDAPSGVDTSLFWSRDKKLRSKFFNQQSLYEGGGKPGLAQKLNDEAACVVSGCNDSDKLWVLQGILTFDEITLGKYLLSGEWNKLVPWLAGNKGAAYSVNDWVKYWVLNGDYASHFNILLGDWSKDAQLVITAVAANLTKAGLDPLNPGIEGLPLFDSMPLPAPQTLEEASVLTVPVVIPPSDIRIEATGKRTPVELGEAVAYDYIDGWLEAQSDTVESYPIGKHQIVWSSRDAVGVEGVEIQTVWVVAHRPQADKTELWPVNRRMVTVTIDANVVPALQGLVTLSAFVDSNLPQDGMGPSDKGPDWSDPQIDQANGTIQVALRAERWDDIDRLYAITVTATDADGHESHEVVQVMVPPTKKANTPDCYNENAGRPVGHCAKQ